MARAQADRVADLNERLTDTQVLDSSRGIQFCTDLLALSRSLDWEAAAAHCDSVSELYETAAHMCPPTLASHMLAAVEAAAERYARGVAADELTSVHAALSLLCAQLQRTSPYLALFTRTSKLFPPLAGPSEYFANSAAAFASCMVWSDAALHAALAVALAQEPDADLWRAWVLYELIAFGETRELPRTVQSPPEKCPLVAELATYFRTWDSRTGRALQQFCAEHESALTELGICTLAKRCCISYYVKWLCRLRPSLGVVSWDCFAPTLSPISLDDLLAAGLERYFVVTRSRDGLVFVEPRPLVRDTEKALQLLDETSLLAALLA